MTYDPTAARSRLEQVWNRVPSFGAERNSQDAFLDLVRDRAILVRGMQVLRDELHFASTREGSPLASCGADFSVPSVVTTLAHTNCGDRIHGGTIETYERLVASRFATMSIWGSMKPEAFFPTGGGTDDGATLAHVTVAHQLDELLRKWVYQGNPSSFVLVNVDLSTHVGRLDEVDMVNFGRAQESPFREPRAACGAIVGALTKFDKNNAVHRRIRKDLGEAGFALLSTNRIVTGEGADITYVIAAAIVAVQGMQNTLEAITHELDDRGLAHMTASVTVNRASGEDTLIPLARGTAFGKETRSQGFGTDATRYAGRIVEAQGEKRLFLSYDGFEGQSFPVVTAGYEIPRVKQATRFIPIPTDLDLT
jgi:hypothetical protein